MRARINVLSEIPGLWRLNLGRWRDWNRSKKRTADGRPAPTRNDEYLLYQTLIGAWPTEALNDSGWQAFSERIENYMLKSARESKERTSWANQNSEYEGALQHFVRSALQRRAKNRFLADFFQFQQRIARIGMFNSLSQCLLKMTSPGVPDIYQGNELWQLSLVDPDNRHPVDYRHRQELLKRLPLNVQSHKDVREHLGSLLANMDSGFVKLYLTQTTLALRGKEALVFEQGRYIPLQTHGQRSEHILAFARELEGRTVIIAVPRLCATLLGENFDSPCEESLWGDTTLEIPHSERACYHQVFTGECIPVDRGEQGELLPAAKLFRDFPVALLVSEPLGTQA